jgi:hypothetical protein
MVTADVGAVAVAAGSTVAGFSRVVFCSEMSLSLSVFGDGTGEFLQYSAELSLFRQHGFLLGNHLGRSKVNRIG